MEFCSIISRKFHANLTANFILNTSDRQTFHVWNCWTFQQTFVDASSHFFSFIAKTSAVVEHKFSHCRLW